MPRSSIIMMIRIVLLTNIVGACVTSTGDRFDDFPDSNGVPTGFNNLQTLDVTPQQEARPTEEVEIVDEGVIRGFVQRHSAARVQLSDEDRFIIPRLSTKFKRGSLEEAACALAAIALTLDQNLETSLDSTPATSEPIGENPLEQTRSLEEFSKEFNLEFLEALSENPYLHKPGVLVRAYRTMKFGKPSQQFAATLKTSIKSLAEEWSYVSEEIIAKQSGQEEFTQTQDVVKSEDPEDTELAMEEVLSADDVLIHAKSLADKRMYKEAVEKVAEIPEGSPLFATAQEKISEYSDLGVRYLRQQAAIEFQGAAPLKDLNLRLASLTKAKRYLESAIESFPESSQIPTVKANLQVIERNLEKLEDEAETEGTEIAR